VGYLEKLASYQGNKEDIDKRRKKKKDFQVFNTPGATQTLADIENFEHDEILSCQNSRILLIVLFTRKTLLELLGIGGVMLLNHCYTHKGGDNLCRNHSKLQIGNLIFNHLKAQYLLTTTRPWGWLRRLSTLTGLC
jgi:hypothetical protein